MWRIHQCDCLGCCGRHGLIEAPIDHGRIVGPSACSAIGHRRASRQQFASYKFCIHAGFWDEEQRFKGTYLSNLSPQTVAIATLWQRPRVHTLLKACFQGNIGFGRAAFPSLARAASRLSRDAFDEAGISGEDFGNRYDWIIEIIFLCWSSGSSVIFLTSNASSNSSASYDTLDSYDAPGSSDFPHERQPESPDDETKRVHFLGVGSIGMLVAHSIRGIANPPPTTLIFRRPGLFDHWKASAKELRVTTKGVTEAIGGFESELVIPPGRDQGPWITVPEPSAPSPLRRKVYVKGTVESGGTIHNLIVTVKAPFTVNALMSIRHRLRPESTVLLLQNGMGMLEQVCAEVFPDAEQRPNFMLGVTTHGASTLANFSISHAGRGTLSLSIVPRQPFANTDRNTDGDTGYTRPFVLWPGTSRYLLRTITRTPVLTAVGYGPTEQLLNQLEKLAVNAIINPLTALFDVRNGGLLHNYSLSRVMRLLIAEISLVIQALPETSRRPEREAALLARATRERHRRGGG